MYRVGKNLLDFQIPLRNTEEGGGANGYIRSLELIVLRRYVSDCFACLFG